MVLGRMWSMESLVMFNDVYTQFHACLVTNPRRANFFADIYNLNMGLTPVYPAHTKPHPCNAALFLSALDSIAMTSTFPSQRVTNPLFVSSGSHPIPLHSSTLQGRLIISKYLISSFFLVDRPSFHMSCNFALPRHG